MRLSLSATPSIRELNETSDLSEDIDEDMVVRRQKIREKKEEEK